MSVLAAARERLGEASTTFECCDTIFTVSTRGPRAASALDRARTRARDLESQLDAFDSGSAVTRLNETGRVENEHVARLVERGRTVTARTDGAFDICAGSFEHRLKRYLRRDADSPPESAPTVASEATVTVEGNTVESSVPLDLNGLAKGYIVDRTREAAAGVGRTVFVSGGGDMTAPPGVVAVESPWGGDPLAYLDTGWAVATSGGYRRERAGHDHVYDARDGTVGTRHDSVTVLARQDCTTADALATALATLPYADALALAEAGDGVEALLVTDGVFRRTEGFADHVAA